MLNNLYLINLWAFLLWVILFWMLEYFFAFRENRDRKILRWGENFSLTFLNTLIIRILFFITPLSAAIYATENNIGIFHYFSISLFLAWVISFFILELIVYAEHILFHKVPFLWGIHSVHHSDLDMDFSTALRFHFLESIFSVMTKIVVIFLLWAPILSVVVFEILLNLSAMFHHSNFNLPKRYDKFISKIFVTPKFHEIHHSQVISDSMSNYGFFLSLWDRVFSTYEPHQKTISDLGLTKQKKRYTLKDLFFLHMK